MTHGSLFSGIGGFDLAAEWMGWQNIFHCEWNPFGQKVLKHYWPNAISYENICTTDFTVHRGKVDIITGGFPCQPYSLAGKRKGKEDERHLWPEMLRTIREVEPSWIVGENVFGLVNWNDGLVFHEVQSDLEAEGYEVFPFLLPACSVNAPHRRDRIWFVAHSKGNGSTICQLDKSESKKQIQTGSDINGFKSMGNVTNSECIRFQEWSKTTNIHNKESKTFRERCEFTIPTQTNSSRHFISKKWESFPTVTPICDGDDGLSDRLDNITISKWRNESIKAGGNAIVPQVAYQIFKTIQEYERIRTAKTN